MSDILNMFGGSTTTAEIDNITIYEKSRYTWQPRQVLRVLPKLMEFGVQQLKGIDDAIKKFPEDRRAKLGALINQLTSEIAAQPNYLFPEEPAIREIAVHRIEVGAGQTRKFTSFPCTKSATTPCVVCDGINASRPNAKHPDELDFLSRIGVERDIVCRVVVRGEAVSKGEFVPKIYLAKLPVKVFDYIKSVQKQQSQTGQPIDITDMRMGCDIAVEREGSGMNAKYAASVVMSGLSPLLSVNGVLDEAGILELLLRARLEAPFSKAYQTPTMVEQVALLQRVGVNAQALLSGNMQAVLVPQQGAIGGPAFGAAGFGQPMLGAAQNPHQLANQQTAGMGAFTRQFDVTPG